MSQKINPISNKLGISKNWNYKFQKYGKSFKGYIKYIQPRKFIFNYINRFLSSQEFLIEHIEIVQFTHQTLIKVFLVNHKNKQVLIDNVSLVNNISYWLKSFIKIELYKKTNLTNCSFLLINYVTYLFFLKIYSPKKILQIIYDNLKIKSQQINFIYTNKGIQIVKIKGFKLELTGCFEASRSQMSKTLKCNFGSVPLTRLCGYIDYSCSTLFTKYGSCGFKLWIFYELI